MRPLFCALLLRVVGTGWPDGRLLEGGISARLGVRYADQPKRFQIALLFFLLFMVSVKSKELSGQELLDFVSKNKQLWVPKPEILNSSEVQRYGVMDVKYIQIPEGAPTLELGEEIELGEETEEIPEFFDARQKWPECISIGWIRDQSNCGSCWAVAAAEVASDRMCINPPYYSMMLSSEDILSCCGRQCYQQEACRGGYPFAAMNCDVDSGGRRTGSSPAPSTPITRVVVRPCPGCSIRSAPRCQQQCQQSYPRDYTQDKYFAEEAYYVPGDVTTIQREILAHGPVEAAFRLFQDFYHVGKRIYHGQVPYWLAVNSWGAGWGDQGLFRILRGNNECGFEDGIVAALPRS